MASGFPFENPLNGLENHELVKREYRYEAYRLNDCTLLGQDGNGGIENLTMVEYDSKLWACGGVDHNNELLLTVLVYDIKRNLWRFGKPLVRPPRRMSHTSVTFAESMFIFGGCSSFGTLNDLWEYHFRLEMWMPWNTGPPWPAPRMRHGASMFGTMLTIFGGTDPRRRGVELLGDMWTINLTQNRFNSPPRWNAIEFHGTVPADCQGVHVTVKQYIFVWEWETAVLSKFDYFTRTWSVVMYDEQLEGHLLLYRHTSIFTFGGTVNDCLANELKVWDTRNKQGKRFWLCDSEGDQEPPARRNGAGVAVGDSIFAFGGRNEERRLCDLWLIKSWEVDSDGVPIND